MAGSSHWAEFDRVLHDPASTPLDVLRVVGTYRRYLAAVEEHAVRAARRMGTTWEDIGAALGVSRQAAWQRLRQAEEAVRAAADADKREQFQAEELKKLAAILRHC
ncbi:MAG: hypothetical protein M3O70_15335 [Actinomycetota bacterium]|nr:hypothetical protein [Actinomycetota bacterium]